MALPASGFPVMVVISEICMDDWFAYIGALLAVFVVM